MATQAVSFQELETAPKQQTPAVTAATATVPETPPAAQTPPQFSEANAQALRILADAGITITNYKELLQAKSVMDNLPKIIRSNPRVLTGEIAKSDPEAYDNFLEAVSDEWYEVKGKKLEAQTATNGASSTVSSSDPRLEALQAKLDLLIADRNQEKTERQQGQILDGYNKAIEGLLAKPPEGVPEQSKDYIRLKTNELVWKDNSARDRVAKGVYVDLPKFLAEASAKATADTKAAADKEHARRQEVENRGTREITPAAENVNGHVETPGEDPIWGDSGLARDVQAALKAK